MALSASAHFDFALPNVVKLHKETCAWLIELDEYLSLRFPSSIFREYISFASLPNAAGILGGIQHRPGVEGTKIKRGYSLKISFGGELNEAH